MFSYLLSILLFFSTQVDSSFQSIDQYSYADLDSLVRVTDEKALDTEYLEHRLQKSISDNNKREQVQSYIKLFHHNFGNKVSLDYIDKAIVISDELKDPELQFETYHRKAYQKLNLRDYKNVEYYIKQSKIFADRTAGIKNKIDVLDTEAMRYRILDSTDLALNIYLESLAIYDDEIKKGKEIDTLFYIGIHASIANAYNILLDKSSFEYANRGLILAQNFNSEYYENFFFLLLGIAESNEFQYDIAISRLQNIVPKVQDDASLYSVVLQYLSKCFLGTGDLSHALDYLEELEKIIQSNGQMRFCLKESYGYFFEYYQNLGEYQKALEFKLKQEQIKDLYEDEVNELENDLISEIGSPEGIWNSFISSLVYLVTIFLVAAMLIAFYFKKSRSNVNKKKTLSKKLDKNTLEEILEYLNRFEKSNEFLNVTTLSSLAKACNTNTTYLSKVVNDHKKKNFNKYINELRIIHFLDKAETDPDKFNNLTILGIAKELGFKSSKTFGKAFKEKTGKNPSQYLENKTQ